MGKQWVRAQIRRNEVQDTVDRGIRWLAGNRRTAGIAAGIAAAVLLCAGLFLYTHHAKRNASWEGLSLAQGYAYNGQPDQAVKKIDELNAEYPTTQAAGFGLLFAGDILYHRGQYKETMKYYNQILDRGEPQSLVPFALGSVALALEASGQCPEALKTQERFLQTYHDHFLAPQVHSSLARCQAALGQGDAAKATFQKIVIQYPDSSWASWAQERLKALGGGA